MRLGEQYVNTTTPVGIYASGVSPYGLYDCAGNVWERCATRGSKAYPYQLEDEWGEAYLEGTNVRVLRGGAWLDDFQGFAHCAYRDRGFPNSRNGYLGCRVVVSPSF
jgi:formylglycine-generating enzyme required for sulfatase activity